MKISIVILTIILFTMPYVQCRTEGTDSTLIRVATIDTGINPSLVHRLHLCRSGHRDFTGTGIRDQIGHGTHISGLIDLYAGADRDHFCQIILKYYSEPTNNSKKNSNLKNTIRAIRWAISIGVDVINYSSGGSSYDREEADVIKLALDSGIIVVVAAGNNGKRLGTKGYKYYPAMYDSRLIIVGNLNSPDTPHITSNYGSLVNRWEVGSNILSYCHYSTTMTCHMTGTSQATAITSGKIISQMLYDRSLGTINIKYQGENYEAEIKGSIYQSNRISSSKEKSHCNCIGYNCYSSSHNRDRGESTRHARSVPTKQCR